MSAAGLDRVLRAAGALLVAAIVAAAAWAALSRPESSWLSGTTALGGTIEHYADDAIVISTSSAALRSIRVGPDTVVKEAAPTTVAALRPGRFVAVRGTAASPTAPFDAREILVWGGPR